jgi:methyltransferase-like protein
MITATSLALVNISRNGRVGVLLPRLVDGTRSVFSAHNSRVKDLNEFIERTKAPYLIISVSTNWGEVSHALPGQMLFILELIDGKRTGAEVYDRIISRQSRASITEDQQLSRSYSMQGFCRDMGILRRLGAIDFTENSGIKKHI